MKNSDLPKEFNPLKLGAQEDILHKFFNPKYGIIKEWEKGRIELIRGPFSDIATCFVCMGRKRQYIVQMNNLKRLYKWEKERWIRCVKIRKKIKL